MSQVLELVKHFAILASLIETTIIFKMKQLHYNNALLFLYKNHNHKLPSFTSTVYLGTSNWHDAELNLINHDDLKTEDDWMKYFKQVYHDGAPQDITRCSLS